MKYRYLGNSGLLVSRICLGTMTFGNPDWGCDGETAKQIVNTFVENGGNFIDTADMYSGGASEEMLGKALEAHSRDDLVIATKCWFRKRPTPNAKGLSRKHIIEACEASLKRIGLEYIDLYQLHGPDPYTPIEETMRSLDDLVRSGKVRYVGCSNFYAWQFVKANGVSERRNQERLISGQYMYNLIRRDVEREILPACEDQGMGLLCWSPLASGFLTGKYQGSETPAPETRIGKRIKIDFPRYWGEGTRSLIDELVKTAGALGKSPAQTALSWLLKDQRVTAAIIGARTVDQTAANAVCGDWDLPDEDRQRLTDMLPLEPGYPKDWMVLGFDPNIRGEEFPPNHIQRLP